MLMLVKITMLVTKDIDYTKEQTGNCKVFFNSVADVLGLTDRISLIFLKLHILLMQLRLDIRLL